MSRSRRPLTPTTRVVGPDGVVDAGALQRQLDRFAGHVDGLASSAVSGLASSDIDVIRTEADPSVSGHAARVGSLLIRVRSSVASAGYYIKTGPSDTDWDRLVQSGDRGRLMLPPYASSIAGGIAVGNGLTYVNWMGRTHDDLTTVTARWEVTTLAVNLSWCELAILTGPVVFADNPVLTVVGWADISTRVVSPISANTFTSTEVTLDRELPAGSDIWVGFGARATTTNPQFRALTGEPTGCGATARATVRPSTVVGRETGFFRDTTVATTPYAALFA